MTTTADTAAARRIVNLWLDGISYGVDKSDIERLHAIASGVISDRRSVAMEPVRKLAGELSAEAMTSPTIERSVAALRLYEAIRQP